MRPCGRQRVPHIRLLLVNSLWLKLGFEGYGLQPVHKPCIISGALVPEGGFSRHLYFHHSPLRVDERRPLPSAPKAAGLTAGGYFRMRRSAASTLQKSAGKSWLYST
jgi:hypothetical protein